MSIDAMKLALEALEEINKLSIGENAICLPAEIDGAITALRSAIEARQWQALTDDEIDKLRHLYDGTAGWTIERFARQIEAKLKEKNHG